MDDVGDARSVGLEGAAQACRIARFALGGGGTLAPGAVADIVVLDPTAKWTVDPGVFHSKSHNTPFTGRPLTGRAILTIVAGTIVHEQ